MTVIRIEKIWTPLPAIQSMKAFIGIALAGAKAVSQAFYKIQVAGLEQVRCQKQMIYAYLELQLGMRIPLPILGGV